MNGKNKVRTRGFMVFKRLGVFLLIVASILCLPLSGCKGNESFDIVVTGFSQCDWVKNILGDNPANFKVKYLLDNGVDLHNYMPSVSDIVSISTCKLFIYTDRDAEEWITNALENPKNKDRKTINLMSLLNDEERITLEEDDDHVHNENCDHEYDEHIWLSIKLTQRFVLEICDRLCVIDPDNSQIYEDNAQDYIDKLIELDGQFENMIETKTKLKLLFADRYPFAYMMKDYNIEVMSAFNGCDADTEISVQKVAKLKEYLTQNSLNYVLILENSNDGIAKQIISGTNAQIKTLNSMQSVTVNQLNSSYISIMQSNLEVLSLVLE